MLSHVNKLAGKFSVWETQVNSAVIMTWAAPRQVREWSLLIPGTGAEGNIIFSPKTHNPSNTLLQIFIPHLKIFQNFHTPTCARFLCVDNFYDI